jgi:hypothetical protein
MQKMSGTGKVIDKACGALQTSAESKPSRSLSNSNLPSTIRAKQMSPFSSTAMNPSVAVIRDAIPMRRSFHLRQPVEISTAAIGAPRVWPISSPACSTKSPTRGVMARCYTHLLRHHLIIIPQGCQRLAGGKRSATTGTHANSARILEGCQH